MLAEVEFTTPFRCNRCWQLEERGIHTRVCNTCHYIADSAPPRPTASDLAADPSRVHEELLSLTPAEREAYDYWLELTLDAGWERSIARRTAFRRARTSTNGSRGPRPAS